MLLSDDRGEGSVLRGRRASRALGLVVLVGAAASAWAQPAPLRWPLEVKPAALTSTFGETRSSSFHAGVDLKTWGKTGYPVHAVAGGWVERLRTSPWGYGRALYQRLDDGRLVVYAHLEGFFGPAAERVRAQQQHTRQYTVDLWLKEGEIPVRRGQRIATTGQSGSGPPHLHLEIRDAANAPVNPLLNGIGPVADTTPPVLRGLVLMPVGPGSTVDGGHVRLRVPLRGASRAGRYTAAREVPAWGRVGIGVDAHDLADEAPNKLAPLVHELHVDGRRILSARYRRFTYADRHQVALDRLRLEGGGPVYTLLYRRTGNRLSFYETDGGGDGTLTCGPGGLEPGLHRVEVRAGDAAGNESRAALSLHCSPPPRIRRARLTESADARFLEADLTLDGNGRLAVTLSGSPDGRDWKEVLSSQVPAGDGPFTWELPDRSSFWRLEVRAGDGPPESVVLAAAARSSSAAPPDLRVRAQARPLHALVEIESSGPLSGLPLVQVTGSKEPVAARQLGHRSYRAVIPLPGPDLHPVLARVTARGAGGLPARQDLALSGQRLRPGTKATLRYLEDRVRLQAPAGAAYGTLIPQARQVTPEASKGLRATGFGCRLGPADAAFDKPLRLWLKVPEGVPAEGLAVYSDNGRGRWGFRGRDPEEGGRYLAASVRALGRFALMIDETPPAVSGVQPAAGSTVTAAAPRFSARVRDQGSGIGREKDVVLELDGIRLVSEYDPEAGRVTAEPDGPLPAGAHTLVITVRDRAANETRREVPFTSR